VVASLVEGTAVEDVGATKGTRAVSVGLVVLAALLAWLMKEDAKPFSPASGFVLFTGFYVAAQAIERLLELLPPGDGGAQAKANRAVLFPAVGVVLGVLAAEKLGLYYLKAVGVTGTDLGLDVFITALAISGGTKPLHDAIGRIEAAKDTAKA
jgi:hypothetical protein